MQGKLFVDTKPLAQNHPVASELAIEIDYTIIEHFSKNLYKSPSKTVEELVANGFDAAAHHVYVYTPEKLKDDNLLVWDDGVSMNVDDLHKLWWIARSPKANQRAANKSHGRSIIGKFGIGKLASFAIGDCLAHLCKQNDKVLYVEVDYRKIKASSSDKPSRFTTEILELTIDEAKQYVKKLLSAELQSARIIHLLDKEQWTLAVVRGLRHDMIKSGRLRWILGNGMPLRDDFKIFVDDTEVVPSLEKKDAREILFSDAEIQEKLESIYVDNREDFGLLNLPERVTNPTSSSNLVGITFPHLGEVQGYIRIFPGTITTGRSADYGRSHGVFLYVRGRLINPDEPVLLLDNPAVGPINSSQLVIYADGLDDDLLADRERLADNSPRIRELKMLIDCMYRVARRHWEARLDAVQLLPGSGLPSTSLEHYRRPLAALLDKHQLLTRGAHVEQARIEPIAAGASARLVDFDYNKLQFVANIEHPLHSKVQSVFGSGKKYRDISRILNVLGAADVLLEGILLYMGLEQDVARNIIDWKEGYLREIAKTPIGDVDQCIATMHETSFYGDKDFEIAVVRVLQAMGFHATRDGRSGAKDVFFAARVGPQSYKFIIECKGSKSPIKNSDADVSGAAAHRDEAKAEHAIIVARKFAGFEKQGSDEPMIIKECRSTQGVSLMTTQALEELCLAVTRFGYPLDLLREVFTDLSSPDEKLAQIRLLRYPGKSFDYPKLLSEIWGMQAGESAGDWVPLRSLWQRHFRDAEPDFGRFLLRVGALEAMLPTHFVYNREKELAYLKQSPEILRGILLQQFESIDD